MSSTGYCATAFKQISLLAFVISASYCISPSPAAQTVDEAALHALAEKLLRAYERSDLEQMQALWSRNSPTYPSAGQETEKVFAFPGKLELKKFSIGKITVYDRKAALRVTIDGVLARDLSSSVTRLNRTLHFIREGAVWKLEQALPSEIEMAAALANAKSDEERKAMLAADHELVNADLQKALLEEAHKLSQNQYLHAATMYELTRNIAEQLGDKSAMATALRGIGRMHAVQAQYKEALKYYQESLKFAQQAGDKMAMARTLNNIGNIEQLQGNFANALELFERSLALARQTPDESTVGLLLGNIASVHYLQGSYAKANEYYQKNLELVSRSGDKTAIARAMNGLGSVYYAYGSYKEALEYYQKVLEIRQGLGNKADIAQVLNNIGVIYGSQGNYIQALNHYGKALEMIRAVGNKQSETQLIHNIGNVYRGQGNYAQALTYYQEVLKLSEEIGEKFVTAGELQAIGEIHFQLEDNAKALEYYRKSLKLYEEMEHKAGINRMLSSIGSVHLYDGDAAQARKFYQDSLKLRREIGDKEGVGRITGHMGLLEYTQGGFEQAVQLTQQAVAIAREIGDPETISEALTTQGRACLALKQPERAKQALGDAIETIEKWRTQVAGGEQDQQRFFEGRVTPYYAMVDLLVGQNNALEALIYAERAKGRILLDVLREGRVNIEKAMNQQERLQERQLSREIILLNAQFYNENSQQEPSRARLDDLKAKLAHARLQYEAFQTNLYAAHPELKVRRGQVEPFSLEQMASLVPDNKTALIEFVVMEDKTYLFIITKEGKAGHDIEVRTLDLKQKALADLVSLYRKRLANRDFSFQDLADRLYAALLKPAQARLKDKSRLVIVPDGVLWELPFQALRAEGKRYLIEDYAISYAPSLMVLTEMTRQRRKPKTGRDLLLAFGNPYIAEKSARQLHETFMSEKLDPLPEAERQVKTLRQLYGPNRSQVYTGSEALEERFKAAAGKYRILHLATHGLLNDKNPMYSHLLFSQAQKGGSEDGLLEAWEIMKLDLNAELVVLSACETALGRLGTGEGIIGLTWALFVAGSPATLVSQWKVESASTTELMLEFHRNLKLVADLPALKMTKAEALRRAALKLMKSRNHRDPFYWAGFVIIGDGR